MNDGRILHLWPARWVEVRRSFTPPRAMRRLAGYEGRELDRILLGITVIEYHDRKGRRRPRFVEVVGDQRVLDLDPDDSRRGRLQQDPTSGGTP